MSPSALPQPELPAWPDLPAWDVDMDPYVVVCRALAEAGVPFLVIGAFGINLHATEDLGIVTYDLDLLLPARIDTVGRAFRCLAEAGCTFAWQGAPMPVPDQHLLGDIVKARACVTAVLGTGAIDIVLQAALLDFDDLWPRRQQRTLGTLSVDTAPLRDLLLSKEAANRSKDRLFIETWREQLERMLAAEERRRSAEETDPG